MHQLIKITFKTLSPAGPSTHEAFVVGILGRFAGCDVVPVKLAIIYKLQHCVRGELGPVACWE